MLIIKTHRLLLQNILLHAIAIVFGNLFLVALTSATSHADNSRAVNNSEIRFSHLGLDDGLSQSSVFTILQDSQDFLWFGTLDGLNKYDGTKFKIYRHDPENTNSLSHNYIHRLIEDNNGMIWIGTNIALTRFDPRTETFKHYRPYKLDQTNKRNNGVFSLLQDEQGTLWIGTQTGLVSMNLDSEDFTYYNQWDTEAISALYVDSDNNLWVGSNLGLAILNRETGVATRFQHQAAATDSLSNNQVTAIHEDKLGLWVGTKGGLNLYHRDSNTFTRILHDDSKTNSLSSNDVSTILEDYLGNLWVGTRTGVNRLDRQTFSFITYNYNPYNPQSITGDEIRILYEDRNRIIWVGANGAELSYYDPRNNSFTNFYNRPGHRNSLSHRIVRSVIEDRANNLWVGTDTGVDKFDTNRNLIASYSVQKNLSDGLTDKVVRAVYEDSRGNIWIGTPKGLSKLNPVTNKFTHYFHHDNDPTSLADSYIRVILEDTQQRLWIGTNAGLSKYNPDSNTFTSYYNKQEDPNTLNGGSIRSLYEDNKGRLWIGTYEGLNLYHADTNTFTRYSYPSEKTNTSIDAATYSIDGDSKGLLWLGTPSGIIRFDPELINFTFFREEDGLVNDTVYSLRVDKNDAIWAATNKGLSMLNQKTMRFINYTKSSGLQDNEFNSNAHFHNIKTGQLYFGGINGLTTFHPDNIQYNTRAPIINVTDFKIFNREVAVKSGSISADKTYSDFSLDQAITYTDSITLSYTHNDFYFEFVALDFSAPEKNQYAYQLVGYDDDWVYSGNRRNATFTNLNPGNYTFKVKGTNSDGVWNEKAATINITITPPWWHTITFRISSAILFIALIFGGIRWRVRSVESYNRELKLKVEEQTSELKEAQKALMNQAHQAGMAEIASSVLHNIGNVLNSVNISSDMLIKKIQMLKADGLKKVSAMLSAHIDSCEIAKRTDTKVGMLPNYILKMADQIEAEKNALTEESDSIKKHITHIRSIINMQQSTARTTGMYTLEKPDELLEEALEVNKTKLLNSSVRIIKDYKDTEAFVIDKHKVVMVLTNLISNAIDATIINPENNRIITLSIPCRANDLIKIQVIDNGIGISDDVLQRIFSHGFTTKKSGHGFGLHSSSLAATQLGGSLITYSDGVGKGATFTLSLPIKLLNADTDQAEKNLIKIAMAGEKSSSLNTNSQQSHQS